MLGNMIAKKFLLSRNCIDAINHLGSTRMLAYKGASIEDLKNARPYESIPKVPMLPGLGSSWAYLPVIGKNISLAFIEFQIFSCLYS